jgi:hypothetical protein
MLIKDSERRKELGRERGHHTLDMGCRLHDSHHCVGEGLSSIERLLPRIVKATGAQDTSPIMHRMKRALLKWLEDEDHTKYFIGEQPEGPAKRFRLAALEAFWIVHGAGRRSEREYAFIQMLVNGNWKNRGALEHYCPGPHCCSGEEDWRAKLRKHLGNLIFSAAMPRISQHRWTGHIYSFFWDGAR